MPLDRDPHFGRKLRADSVKRERREQADHPVRDRARGYNETVMLGDRPASETILAASDPVENPLPHEAGQVLAVDSHVGCVCRGNDRPALGEREQAGLFGARHV
jgi:hypothetical protein